MAASVCRTPWCCGRVSLRVESLEACRRHCDGSRRPNGSATSRVQPVPYAWVAASGPTPPSWEPGLLCCSAVPVAVLHGVHVVHVHHGSMHQGLLCGRLGSSCQGGRLPLCRKAVCFCVRQRQQLGKPGGRRGRGAAGNGCHIVVPGLPDCGGYALLSYLELIGQKTFEHSSLSPAVA